MALKCLEDGKPVRLVQSGDHFFCLIEGLGLHGSGPTVDIALADLDRRYSELGDFSRRSGVALETLSWGVPLRARPWWQAVRQAGLIIVVFGLMMVPLSYALSGAFERALVNLNLAGGRVFWRNVEDSLVKSADPASAPSAEEQTRIRNALRALVQRIKPYADEIKPLFSEPVPRPEKQDQ